MAHAGGLHRLMLVFPTGGAALNVGEQEGGGARR